jgi:translation initiation factor IF-1
MFDRARTIDITGVVKEFLWVNPHASFKVEVQDEKGETKLWYIEMNGVSNLVHEGWKRSTIKPGDKVTVTVNPLRDGRPGGWYLGITLANGQKLGTPGAAPP